MRTPTLSGLCQLSSACSVRLCVNGSQWQRMSLLLPSVWCVSSPYSFVGQRRGLADEKAVKNRMRSVQSIQKITKAMKMVAASKLRHDQKRRDMGIPFCAPAIELFNRLPFTETRVTTTASDLSNKDVMYVCLSSDKGLCGGANSAVAKLSRRSIKEEESRSMNVSIIGVGEKIRAALERVFGDRFTRIIDEVAKVPVNFSVAAIIAERIAQGPVGRVAILHNHFRSVIAYDTQKMEVLSASQAKSIKRSSLDMFEFEPEQSLLWNDLHEFYLACAVFNCLLDNGATEQSQRMSAMDNASKNAGEMLSELTLSYNKARQMKITMELIEIISGANAL